MSKRRHSLNFGGGQSSLSSPRGKWTGVKSIKRICSTLAEFRQCGRATVGSISSQSGLAIAPSVRKSAFTLAEVLITLGIIGVVAAMTLPTLVQNYKKHEVETRLKKFYTTMNQAVLMAKNDFGDFKDWDFWIDHSYDNEGNINNKSDDVRKSFEKYLKPYLNIVDTKELLDEDGNKENYIYYFTDGSAFSFGHYSTNDIFYYINQPEKCIKSENNVGRCRFIFQFNPISSTPSWIKYRNKGVEPYKMSWMNDDVSFLYNQPSYGCNENGGKHYCTAVIQLNGWKIPENYPIKF